MRRERATLFILLAAFLLTATTDGGFDVIKVNTVTAATAITVAGSNVITAATGVVGPASATDNAVCRYDGTTGKLIQDSTGVNITDTGILQVTTLAAGGNAINVMDDNGTTVDGQIYADTSGLDSVIMRSANATGGIHGLTTTAGWMGRISSIGGSTSTIGGICENISTTSGTASNTDCPLVTFSAGHVGNGIVQTITCVTDGGVGPGTATMNIQSANVTVVNTADAQGCVVTVQDTSANTIALPGLMTYIDVQVSGSGGGVTTFPDVTDVWDAPTLCSTTGLPNNGGLIAKYSDRANDLWVVLSCTTP